ncbi:MAG: FG-GAP-like repeat-containing protein [Pseudomonadota bacterium]|nr:FG-GAP-like repeat-containing protein [Pseudomonadota bacterium]
MLLLLTGTAFAGRGLATLALQTELSGAEPANLASRGRAVASVDVDGDGLSDVVVVTAGAPDCDGCAAAVHVYSGTPTGPSTTPYVVDGPTGAVTDTVAAVGLGDTDGDGYGEVAVVFGGSVWVYAGSAVGLSASPTVVIAGFVSQGVSAAAGDVNGDGYADLVVGSAFDSTGGAACGAVFVHLGGAAGVSSVPDATILGRAAFYYHGWAVASGADVDGDGYDEVVVGAPQDGGSEDWAGAVYVYNGDPTGVVATPTWAMTHEVDHEALGLSVALADVDGDGDIDVLAGAPRAGVSRVMLYENAGGIATVGVALEGAGLLGATLGQAGDLDGDGAQEVPAGAPDDETGGDDGGALVLVGYDGALPTEEAAYTGAAGAGLGVASAVGDLDADGYDDLVYLTGDDGPGAWVPGGAGGPDLALAVALPGAVYDGGFGADVAGAGDVDGDGYEDVLVYAPWSDDGGPDAGGVYVYAGSASGVVTTPVVLLSGSVPEGEYGHAAGVGDLDGDGLDDVGVGAPAQGGGPPAWIHLGRATGLDVVADYAVTDCRGSVGDRVGSAGDLDGDGFGDAFFSAAWGCYPHGESVVVLFGDPAGVREEHWIEKPYDHADADDGFGDTAAGSGDVDGDGYDDLVAGMTDRYGVMWLFRGQATGVSDWADWLSGPRSHVDWGTGVTLADLDGDGFDDLVVGASDEGTTLEPGAVYVYPGSAAGLASTASLTLTGSTAADHYGRSLANLGDLDGDLADDVAIGIPGAAGGAGEVSVCAANLTACVTFAGTGAEAFGSAVGGADVDGDGWRELLVGVPGAAAGSVRVYGWPVAGSDTGGTETGDTAADTGRDTSGETGGDTSRDTSDSSASTDTSDTSDTARVSDTADTAAVSAGPEGCGGGGGGGCASGPPAPGWLALVGLALLRRRHRPGVSAILRP